MNKKICVKVLFLVSLAFSRELLRLLPRISQILKEKEVSGLHPVSFRYPLT